MDVKDIIVIVFNILFLFIMVYLIYRSYIKQKYYSGKKFIWSKRDNQNEKLKGYHYYENPINLSFFTIWFLIKLVEIYIIEFKYFPIIFIIFICLMTYIIVSYFKERSLRNKIK